MYTLLAQINKYEQEKAQIAELTKTIQDYINDKAILNILLNALRLNFTGKACHQTHEITIQPLSSSKFSNPNYFSFTIETENNNILFQAFFERDNRTDQEFTVEIETHNMKVLKKPVIDYLNDVIGLTNTTN